MKGCWAAALGGCGGGISREHLISAGLWTGDMLTVVGYPWCRTEPKTVPVQTLVSKILCRVHNSALSEIDAAAKRAFHAIRAGQALGNRRHALGIPKKRWKYQRFGVDGTLLERWFLKTAINMTVAYPGDMRWAQGDRPATDPPLELIQMAFGFIPVPPPLGLYITGAIGDQVEIGERVSFRPAHFDNRLSSAIFTFYGLPFLFYLGTAPNPKITWKGAELARHCPGFQINEGKHRSHSFDFSWNTTTT